MNRDIALLREVVVKLTQMLAGMGLKVTQQGGKAFVERDHDGKPLRVNIPQIPDNASSDLITAIQGFVDHEVSRVLFDDYNVVRSVKSDKKLSALHNMVSDTYVEREMGKRFPGSIDNMKRLHEFFLEHITDKALESPEVRTDPMKQFETLIMPMIRAWSGQERFIEYMDKNKLWDLPIVNEFSNKVPKAIKEQIKNIRSPQEALEIARKLKEVMAEEAMNDMGEGEGDGDEESENDGDGNGEKSESDQDSEGDEGENDGEGDGEDEDEGDGEGGGGEDEGDEEDEPTESKIIPERDRFKSSLIGGSKQPNLDSSSFDEAMVKHISKEAALNLSSANYRIFSKDFDVIDTYNVDPKRYEHAWLTRFDDEVRHMIGVMQKDIERMMASQARTVSVPGYRSGKLCAPNLHRLTVGDGRIFKRLEEHKAKDTAVSLVIDNSGSMGGSKMRTAMHAAYALAMTLDRLKIPCEAIGFTTFSYYDGSLDGGRIKAKPGFSLTALQAEESRISSETRKYFRFSRSECLYMPIYKGWNERMTPPVKARFADAANTQRFLNQNIDGECVENAVFRLMTRPERRHVCIVLSDGQPAGHPAIDADLKSHLARVVKDATKMGVEMVGIGINSTAVSSYYPRNFTINNIEELPNAVMKELKRILTV